MRVIMSKSQTEKFKNIKAGTPFCCYSQGYNCNVLYMKTTERPSRHYLSQGEYNIVNIENGELGSISDDALVVVANVHVECD